MNTVPKQVCTVMNQIINPILLVIFKTNCAVVKLDECVLKSLGSMQKN